MPQNSVPVLDVVCDPVLAVLDAARDRWLSTRDVSAVRLFLLESLKAMELHPTGSERPFVP